MLGQLPWAQRNKVKLSRNFLVHRLLYDQLIPAPCSEARVYQIQNPQWRDSLIWGCVVVAWMGGGRRGEILEVLKPTPGK